MIKRPIALIDMQNKCKRNEYKHSIEIKNDLELMKGNAIIFNGEVNPISQTAIEMQNIMNEQLNKRNDEIINLESMIA